LVGEENGDAAKYRLSSTGGRAGETFKGEGKKKSMEKGVLKGTIGGKELQTRGWNTFGGSKGQNSLHNRGGHCRGKLRSNGLIGGASPTIGEKFSFPSDFVRCCSKRRNRMPSEGEREKKKRKITRGEQKTLRNSRAGGQNLSGDPRKNGRTPRKEENILGG